MIVSFVVGCVAGLRLPVAVAAYKTARAAGVEVKPALKTAALRLIGIGGAQ